jgi:hypothetical protein
MEYILGESNSQYNNRLEFIKSIKHQKMDLNEEIRLSKLWYNIKYLNCKYSKKIYHNIKSLDSSI